MVDHATSQPMMIGLGFKEVCFKLVLMARAHADPTKFCIGYRSVVLATRTCGLGARQRPKLDEGHHFMNHAPREHMLSQSYLLDISGKRVKFSKNF